MVDIYYYILVSVTHLIFMNYEGFPDLIQTHEVSNRFIL